MNNKFNLFGASATVTVLKDKPIANLLKREAEIIVETAKNAHEAFQIIICANEDVNEYYVSVCDLVSESGVKIDKRFISVYNCKYTLVKTNVEKFYGFGEGYYPNAVLPMNKAVEYGENKVLTGENQSIYFSFYIPENTLAGVYRAVFSLTVDGIICDIPVCLTVRNVVVSEESHLRTLFQTDWDWRGPSVSEDFVKYKRYTDLLSEYRLNAATLIPYPKVEDLERLYDFNAELAYEYCQNPVNTTFCIPYMNWVKKREDGNGIKGTQSELELGLECDVFENFLSALIKKSLEKDFNIIKRAIIYFGRFIDEPNGQGTMNRLERTDKEYRGILNSLADKLSDNSAQYESRYGVSKQFIAELIESVKHIPHVITASYDEKYDKYIDTYCPNFWVYQVEDSFALYERGSEKWWYGCNGPTSPCPTYHLDDHLLSPRILSWLQYKYGYKGNLFWAVDCYDYKGSGQHEYFDFYSEIKQDGNVNLDGLLCYPGEIYGMDKNVATLRMEEIRAGMEDYEVLYALERAYNDCGASFSSVFAYYMNFISRGIKIIADESVFYAFRRLIFDLYELHFATGLCVFDLYEDCGKLNGRITTDSQYNLCYDGAECSSVNNNGRKAYTFSVPVSSASFTLKGNGIYRSFDLGNVATKITIPAKALKENLKDDGYNIEFVYDGSGDNGIGLIIPTEKGLIQSFKLFLPKEADLTNAVSLVLSFDNKKDGKKFEGINIKAKFEKEKDLRPMLSDLTYLPPLKSDMPVYLSNNDWDKSGKIEYLLISFGENNEEYKLLSQTAPIKKYIYLRSLEIIYKR